MRFWKLHGIGNDFVAIDGREDNIDNNDYGDYARRACHRKFSVGADGLLVVKNSDIADIEMVYYNSDGSRAAMCGNGLRCFVKFVYDNKIIEKDEFDVYTLDGIKRVKLNLKDNEIQTIKVNMGKGSFLAKDVPVNTEIDKFIEQKINVLDREYTVSIYGNRGLYWWLCGRGGWVYVCTYYICSARLSDRPNGSYTRKTAIK